MYAQLVSLCLLVLCPFFTGCATPAAQMPAPLAPAALQPIEPTVFGPAEGSLFQTGLETSLVADFRARRVGDVVTIRVEENLKGAKNVKTQADRKSDVELGVSGFFGLDLEKNIQSRLTDFDATKALGGSTSQKFNGTGKTSRDASLTGTISARVAQVLPGGNLVVEGARQLRINNETQYLILTGVIRPQDIGPDNTVSSTRLADARIEYTGGGVLSETQRPAWFARILGLIAFF